MKTSFHKFLPAAVLGLLLFSCSESETGTQKDDQAGVADSVQNRTPDTVAVKKYSEFNSEKPGGIGVYDVPEMLTLCVHDSADAEHMAAAFARAYTILEKEMKDLKLEANGAPGSLYFNNDPKNFVFECVYPINKIPSRNPKNSRVVVLEATNMYIYNYYGPLSDLYKAYDEIRGNLKTLKLEQSGPMREFYMTGTLAQPDTSKWLTRIMVPVQPLRKK